MKDLLEFPPASAGTETPPVATVPAVASPTTTTDEDAGAAGVLIPLIIEAKGEVISSNFAAFADAVRTRLTQINRSLSTDEQFAQADKDAKAISGAEDALKEAKQKALADAEQLHALFDQIDGLSGDLAAARLELERQIKQRKEEVRREIIDEIMAGFDEIDAPGAKTVFRGGIAAATKGKRTCESMKKAARIQFTIHREIILRNRERIATFEKAHGTTLTLDRHELELKSADTVEADLRRRFDLKKAEGERKRLEAEAATAKAEAKAAIAQVEEAGKPPAPPARTGASAYWPPEEEIPPAGQRAGTVGLTDGPDGPGTIEAPTEHAEWDAFEKAFIAALAPVKTARASLTHQRNISRAQILANSILTAWNNR